MLLGSNIGTVNNNIFGSNTDLSFGPLLGVLQKAMVIELMMRNLLEYLMVALSRVIHLGLMIEQSKDHYSSHQKFQKMTLMMEYLGGI